jgi:hypothetical protein
MNNINALIDYGVCWITVTSVRFANNDNSLIAFAAMDGDLSICYALPEPHVHKRIKAHTEGISGMVGWLVGWLVGITTMVDSDD